MTQCAEDRFLRDTAEHEMQVLRDSGADRHISFRKPENICCGFDLITWPGHLCITGDCGTYVFKRVEDMFTFFRREPQLHAMHDGEKLYINPGYWGEKLLSIGTNAGYKEFDEDRFRERVTEHFDSWKENEEPTTERAKDLWDDIESSIFPEMYNGEHSAYQAVYNFEHDGFRFEDFFDGGGTERYTFDYLWCLYAIVWGIQKYDESKIVGLDQQATNA